MFRRPQLEAVSSADAPPPEDVADRAIGFARQFGTPLTPEVFETWYVYAARENPVIIDTLDQAMNTGDVSGRTLTELYHEHLAPTSTTDALDGIGADLHGTLARVGDAVDENLREHSLFSGTLRSAKQSLTQGTTKREVATVIRELHRANHQHLAAAQKLALQLEKSRAQVAKLKGELLEVKRMSNTDFLTGLPNRRMMHDALDTAIFEARQRRQPLTLLMTQLDGVDAMSNLHGLSTGDGILRTFATTIAREMAEPRVACRFAGSKFAVIMPRARIADGYDMAEHLRKRFHKIGMRARDTGAPIPELSVTFGGAELRAGDDRPSLVDRADSNLRIAHREGDNRSLVD